MHQRVKVELHCRVCSRVVYTNDGSNGSGVDRGMVFVGFSVVESPDRANWTAAIVNKPVMIINPDCNNITFKGFSFIGITFGCFMWKLKGHYQELL